MIRAGESDADSDHDVRWSGAATFQVREGDGVEPGFPPLGDRRLCETPSVTSNRLGIVVAVLAFDVALLLIVGAAMWREAPSPADEAVGKGLVALGGALAVPAFVLLCALLDSRAHATTAQEATRGDANAV